MLPAFVYFVIYVKLLTLDFFIYIFGIKSIGCTLKILCCELIELRFVLASGGFGGFFSFFFFIGYLAQLAEIQKYLF